VALKSPAMFISVRSILKTANNTSLVTLKRSKKYLLKLAIAFSIAGLSACSSNTLKIKKEFKETPEVTRSNMTDAISCMGGALKKGTSDNAYIFLIRDVNDGTVKDSVYQDGPLADSGRIQLINVMSEHLYPHVGLVTDTFPLMFSQQANEGPGLNRFGVPSAKSMNIFMASYAGIIQNARKAKRLPAASNVVPLIVSGSFTRFDTDNLVQQGSGQNIGSRTKQLAENEKDTIFRQASGQIDIGNTSSARALSLVINLIDPRNNLVVSSKALDLIFYRNNKTFRMRIGLGDGYYGVSKNAVTVEGVHGAQKTLLDAAALWLINKAYGGKTDFSSCFSNKQRRITMTAKEIAQIDQKSLEAQDILVEKAIREKNRKPTSKGSKNENKRD